MTAPGITTANWRAHAQCRTLNPSLFDYQASDRENPTDAITRISRGKLACRGCPVLTDCLTYGLTSESIGVFGGQLVAYGKIRPSSYGRGAGAKPRVHAACGTRSGYRRHHRNGETPCEPCMAAERVDSRERRRRTRARQRAAAA